MTDGSGPFVYTVDSLKAVPAAEWDALVGELGLYASHRWLLSMEDEPGVRLRYLLGYRSGELVSALPLQDVADEQSDGYMPARHHQQLTGGGRWLLAGTRRAYSSGVWVRAGNAPQRRADAKLVLNAALLHARREGFQGLVWMYASTPSAELLQQLGCWTAFDSAEAVLYVPGHSMEAYRQGLATRARNEIAREIRVFKRAGYRVDVAGLTDCWRELVPLLAQTQGKYGHAVTEERLERRLQQQASALSDLSVVLLLRDGGRLRGFMLSYVWSGTLYARMLGFDYPNLRRAFEYFNLVYYEPLRLMAEKGLDALHLGREALDAKVRRGALLHPLWTVALPCEPSERLTPVTHAEADSVHAAFAAHVADAREWTGALGRGVPRHVIA